VADVVGFDARLLGQLPVGGVLKVLVDEDEPAGQRPLVTEGDDTPPDEQHPQFVAGDGEHHDVDGHRERRMLARVHAGHPRPVVSI